MHLNGCDIAVLGAGVSGISAARLAASQGAHVTLYDDNPKAVQDLAERLPGVVCIGGDRDKLAAHCDIAVLSPGIPAESPLGLQARRMAEHCTSEHAFGAAFITCPILAVTGTNGKTTTVEMTAAILNANGRKACAAGNIGLPLSQVALEQPACDCVVAETSSFQLELCEDFRPFAAALLNITPDHLSRHGNMQTYRELKYAIFAHVEDASRRILREDLVRPGFEGRTFPVCTDGLESLPNLSGAHNVENALAAVALAAAMGVAEQDALEALKHFRTGDHRLQKVSGDGALEFIDDSKATNVDALVRALDLLHGRNRPIALIAGGLDKGCTLDEAIPALKRDVRHVALIGSCAERLSRAWSSAVPCSICASMEEAVGVSVASLPEGGVVLLSPACASQDMYRDYAQRGDLFRQCARQYRFTTSIQ